MLRKYELLRRTLTDRGYTQEDVAELLGWGSRTPITRRYTGKEPWTLREIYILLDELEIDPSQMHRYFPKDGIQKDSDFPYMRKIHDRSRLAAYGSGGV